MDAVSLTANKRRREILQSDLGPRAARKFPHLLMVASQLFFPAEESCLLPSLTAPQSSVFLIFAPAASPTLQPSLWQSCLCRPASSSFLAVFLYVLQHCLLPFSCSPLSLNQCCLLSSLLSLPVTASIKPLSLTSSTCMERYV